MSLQKGFSTSHICSQLIRADKTHHGSNPGAQITVVTEEALQVIRVQELLLAGIGLENFWISQQYIFSNYYKENKEK